jgi:crotonobetainyl-CoA:carnitine CoA-transferase CaiB-like acyl-CoA transferase
VYRCAGEDDWCVITVRDDHDWAALAGAIGLPPWTSDERYGTAAGRHAAADELDRHLGTWTATLSSREVMDTLQRSNVPAAAVLGPADLLGDPHLQARDFIQVILQPGFDPILVEGDCHTAEHLPTKPAGPAPRQGQHTSQIATELLGLTDDQVDNFVRTGVLQIEAEKA